MTRTAEVYFLPSETDEETFEGKTAIVVDLLRASTTIVTALHSGAREVIPTSTPERAVALRDEIGKAAVRLCGERGGEMIPGFELGNSPREYTPEAVKDKTLLFASSNGSTAILAAREAAQLAVGALVNFEAVVSWAAETAADIVVLCAGKLGMFSAEDAACAGHIVTALKAKGYVPGNDGARVAIEVAREAAVDWPSFVAGTDHGRYLISLGFRADLPVVTALDSTPLVPVWRDGKLVRLTSPVEV